MLRSADGACPTPDAVVFDGGILRPTGRAELAGREIFTDFDQRLASVGELVLKHRRKAMPPVVQRGLAEIAIPPFCHLLFDRDILYAHEIPLLGYRKGPLVQKVISLCGGMGVDRVDPVLLLDVVLGVLLLARKPPLLASELLRRLLVIFRHVGGNSVVVHVEGGRRVIQAQRRIAGRRNRLHVLLEREADRDVVPASALGDGCAFQRPPVLRQTMDLCLDPAELRQLHGAVQDFYIPVRAVRRVRLPGSALALERREPVLPAEEAPVSIIQREYAVCQGKLIDFPQPRECVFQNAVTVIICLVF